MRPGRHPRAAFWGRSLPRLQQRNSLLRPTRPRGGIFNRRSLSQRNRFLPRERIAGIINGASRKALSLTGDRGFDSFSLQERVFVSRNSRHVREQLEMLEHHADARAILGVSLMLKLRRSTTLRNIG